MARDAAQSPVCESAGDLFRLIRMTIDRAGKVDVDYAARDAAVAVVDGEVSAIGIGLLGASLEPGIVGTSSSTGYMHRCCGANADRGTWDNAVDSAETQSSIVDDEDDVAEARIRRSSRQTSASATASNPSAKNAKDDAP